MTSYTFLLVFKIVKSLHFILNPTKDRCRIENSEQTENTLNEKRRKTNSPK